MEAALPTQATPLVGRESEVEEVGAAVYDHYRPDRSPGCERTAAVVRSQPGEGGHEERRAEERAMDFDQAIEYVHLDDEARAARTASGPPGSSHLPP